MSTVNTMGVLSAQRLDCKEQVRFYGAADDTKTISLKLSGDPTQAGDVVYTLPVITGNKTLATTDDVSSLPSSSDSQMLISSGSDNYASVTLSGDVTNSAAGAMTIAAGAVDNNKIAAGAGIEKSKLAALNIADADVAAGAAIAKSKLANLAIADADVAAGAAIAKSKLASLEIGNADVAAGAAIAGSKVAPDFGAQLVQTTGTAQVGSAEAFRFGGDSDGSWRMVIDGDVFKVQKKESGSWVTKGSFSS